MNIVFDFDGTIIDASERLYRLFQDLVPRSALSKEAYWALKRNKINHNMIIRQLYPDVNYDLFYTKWMKQIETEEYLSYDKNYPDTVDVLNCVFRRHTLILLTARQSKEKLAWELNGMGINHFFYKILCTEGKVGKKQKLEEAIFSGEISNEKSDLFVSDVGKDLLIGKEKGYKTIAITHGFMCFEKLMEYEPDYIINELKDLLKIIPI